MDVFCQDCGARLEDQVRFCEACGTPVPISEPAGPAVPRRVSTESPAPAPVRAARHGASPGVVMGVAVGLVLALASGGYWLWQQEPDAAQKTGSPTPPATVTETAVPQPPVTSETAANTAAATRSAEQPVPVPPAVTFPAPPTVPQVPPAPPQPQTFAPPPAAPAEIPASLRDAAAPAIVSAPTAATVVRDSGLPPPPVARPVEPVRPPAPPAPPPYTGPMSGTLTYSGPPVVQQGEIVFRGLPPLKLKLVYDQTIWEGELSPDEQNTQRLVLRNLKPGTQKRCVVVWTVIQ